MKSKKLLLCALLLGNLSLFGQVKIGDNPQTISLSSLLELESTDKALVVSRISTVQMNAITPLSGAIVYNTDIACLFYYDGTEWVNLCEEVPIEYTTDPIVNNAETIVITQNGNVVNFEVGEIDSNNIVDFSIGGIDIQNETITADKLAPNSVGSEELQDNTITDLEMDYSEVTLLDFTNDAGFITAANIISADVPNSITAGTDGGAYFNAEPLEQDIAQLQTDLTLKEDLVNKSTDVNLGTSDVLYPSQNAVKTYVDNVVGGSAQTIVSTDPDNRITAGGDGGAFLNITPLEDRVTAVETDLTTVQTDLTTVQTDLTTVETDLATAQTDLANHIASDLDLDIDNERITDITLNGNTLEITEGGLVMSGDLSALAGTGAQDLGNVLNIGNDGGALQIKNIADPTDPQDAATRAYVDGLAGSGSVEVADQVTIVGDGTAADPFSVADGGIGTLQLANNSVTIEKIAEGADGQVLTTDAAGDVIWAAPAVSAVTSDGVTIQGDGSVGNELQVVDGSIGTTQLTDGGVATLDLADNNVTVEKIAEGADGQVLTTDDVGDVIWDTLNANEVAFDGITSALVATDVQAAIDEVVTNLVTTGDPNGVFFADTGGLPITAADRFIWDPTARFGTGSLAIGMDGRPTGTLRTKVQIEEAIPGNNGANPPAFPLSLRNAIDGGQNGTAVGLLFSIRQTDTYGKGALVYERTETNARGDFHFLQQTTADGTMPLLSDAVMTIKNTGEVGIGTTIVTAGAKLEVQGQTLTESLWNEGFYLDETGATGTAGQVLTATATGTAWANAGSANNLASGDLTQTDANRSYDINGGTLNFSGSGSVGISQATPTSTLHLGGSFATPVQSTSINVTLTAADHTVIVDTGGTTIALPDPTLVPGRVYILKNTSGGAVNTDLQFTNSDGTSTTETAITGVVWLQSDGVTWQQIN